MDFQLRRALGNALCEKRRDCNLTIADVAKVLGVSKQNYDLVELGRRGLKEEDFKKVCDLFQCYESAEINIKIGL